jgi:hypothetical protein
MVLERNAINGRFDRRVEQLGNENNKRNRPANSPWRDEGQRSLRIAMLAVLMLKAVASKGPPHQCQ